MHDLLLTPDERGNPDTGIDRRLGDGTAWTSGNVVTPLIHGRDYFAALYDAISATQPDDLVMFTDWRGDPDEELDDGTSVSHALCDAAARGVTVKGLVWRSHLDLLRFSSKENQRLGAEIEDAGGECLLDMRVRPGGSHHQKMVLIRYRAEPDRDVAFVGGIDLCHSRRDDANHLGDGQPVDMPDVYGRTPAWHDIQVAVRGPAVGTVEATFRERWCDPAPLSHNPFRLLKGKLVHEDLVADPLPEQAPDPAPHGSQTVQVLRTYPYRRSGYPFARQGERSIARAYLKAVGRARSLIYLEDQYLWSEEVVRVFADALRREPELRMIGIVPLFPDTDGMTARSETLGRDRALRMLRAAGGDRVAVYGLENHQSRPVYVHAKVCIIDDTWSCVGSDNLNLRSWTHDSELACAITDTDGGTGFGLDLRLRLNREHLDRADGDDADLHKPDGVFEAYRATAAALDAWHSQAPGAPVATAAGKPAAGQATGRGPRPAGRLRAYTPPPIPFWAEPVTRPIYRFICDPDGRPSAMRRAAAF
jgi:phosphatidylserine/phosphatidylglycerophosphate/cardiolipin synthase-like enzyme